MTHEAGHTPLTMLIALWLGSLVVWGAVAWDSGMVRQWQSWQVARRVEQHAELALMMISASLAGVASQQIEQRNGRLECVPTGCRGDRAHLAIQPDTQGAVLLIKGGDAPDIGYALRSQHGMPTLWMQIAGKGTAVAVVSGIASIQWMLDSTSMTGRLLVTATSGGDVPVERTLSQTVALEAAHGTP